MNREEVQKYFRDRDIDKEAMKYLVLHASRYIDLLTTVSDLKKLEHKPLEILDVGPSFFTELLLKKLPDDKISVLGFGTDEQYRGGHFPKVVDLTRHHSYFEFDLNDSTPDKGLPENPKFDIIIIAEVIEHLYTSPKLVFGFLKNLLKEDGIIIVQTPNATSIDKRIAILRGIHPYELIRENKNNPGHFREYAYYELSEILKTLGMEIVKKSFFNYPPPKPHGILGKALDLFYKFVKRIRPELRDSMTLIAKIQDSDN